MVTEAQLLAEVVGLRLHLVVESDGALQLEAQGLQLVLAYFRAQFKELQQLQSFLAAATTTSSP